MAWRRSGRSLGFGLGRLALGFTLFVALQADHGAAHGEGKVAPGKGKRAHEPQRRPSNQAQALGGLDSVGFSSVCTLLDCSFL